jgi:hypothetical protein
MRRHSPPELIALVIAGAVRSVDKRLRNGTLTLQIATNQG